MRLMMRKIFMPTELLIEVLRYLNYAISSHLLSSPREVIRASLEAMRRHGTTDLTLTAAH